MKRPKIKHDEVNIVFSTVKCEHYNEQTRNCRLHSPFKNNCKCNGNEKKCMYVRGDK